MICKKCGKEIKNNAKFCGNCGEQVENNLNILNDKPIEHTTVIEPITQEINMKEVKKKSNNIWIYIVLGSILIVLALVLLLIGFNNTTNKSIWTLEKSIDNLKDKAENSGTINLNILIESKTSDTINLSSTFKYAEVNDIYNLSLTLNKSLFYDETTLYGKINDEKMTLYAKSSVIDMLGYTKSDIDSWLYYFINTDIEDDIEDELEDLNISEILDDKHFKYISKVNDINHYELIIDQELMIKLQEFTTDDISSYDEQTLTETYIIDFYINDQNEIIEISMDMTNYLNEEDILNATISIEFLDLNNTTVVIPQEVLNSTVDLETYMQMYQISEPNYNYGNDYSYNFGITY